MKLKITRRPPTTEIADLFREDLEVGTTCEVSTLVGSVFLAEGWAEPASEPDRATVLVPTIEVLPFGGLVLLVDDEPAVRHLARILLTHDGYDVVVARHGQDAIERLSGKCPDLIVLDLHMPVMNGWQFRAHQRQLAPPLASVPVLLMTGEVDGDACAAALGAVGVVKKPFAAHALLNAVGAAIRQHRASRNPAVPNPGQFATAPLASADPWSGKESGGVGRYTTRSTTHDRRQPLPRRRTDEPTAPRDVDRRRGGERRRDVRIEAGPLGSDVRDERPRPSMMPREHE